MTQLTIRRLLIDLSTPFERRWNGGDAFRSAIFNALSMSFPVGEQFFIDSVRNVVKTLPVDAQKAFAADLAGFVGQEATHRRIHALYNQHLVTQGYINTWESRIIKRLKNFEGMDPRHPLAVTAANEHFTAVFAEHLLTHPQALENATPRLQTLWLWHASEESEHRSVAFDAYQAAGGSNAWRRRWMLTVTFFFLTDVMRQTVANLAHDGQLWRWSTWKSGYQFLLGRSHGLLRHSFRPWLTYFKADFHPEQYGGERGEQWLIENQAQFKPVGSAA
jgi:uncharacterized protein